MLLEFEHVTGTNKKFALQDVSFALPEGYIMGLAGKNGAGKSTLIDYIVNPVQQYTGTIRIDGVASPLLMSAICPSLEII